MRPVVAILFDAGGTLIHVDGERVCRAAGLPWEAARFRAAEAQAVTALRRFVLEGPSTDSTRVPFYFDVLLSGLGLAEPARRQEAAGRVAAEHRRANFWSLPGDRAAETLAALRSRGYRVAVISNADGRVRGLLETAGLTPHLEFVIDSAEVGMEKPDPRIFHAATQRMGLPPERCAYVGDIYEIDVVGARGAGLTPILIGEGQAPEPVLRVPDLWTLLNHLPPLP